MLQRQYLDERCTVNDPCRVRDQRSKFRDENSTEGQNEETRVENIAPCHNDDPHLMKPEQDLKNEICPTVNVLRERIVDNEKPSAPYFPQPDDNLPAKDEGPMGPIGPWATGRPVFSPTSGMTGVRPVVDRYSVTRYSPAQWRAHNQTFFTQSTQAITEARNIKANVRKNDARIYHETDKNQLENRDRLSKRASEIHQRKTELNQALLEITNEIELLEGEYRRVKQSLSILTIPESIAGEFLQIRQTRLEPDLVRDNVEDELIKEIALCSEVRLTLTKARELIEMQLSELKAVKARLEFDITDKIDAYEIESACVGLTNDSPLILMQPGATRVPAEQSSPSTYENFTKDALQNNEEARQRSIEVRDNLNGIYLKIVKNLRDQAIQVDMALAEKVNVTDQICQELEKELTKCLHELSDTETLIEELRGSSKGLNNAMKVAQTRLANRLERKNVESCRDEPQYGLIEEVKILNENLSAMAGELKRAEETQAGLVKSRSDLEHEIMSPYHSRVSSDQVEMSMPTFCKNVDVNQVPKYRNSIPINDEIEMENPKVALNRGENPMWPCPAEQFVDKRVIRPEMPDDMNIQPEVLGTADEEITECCPLTTPITSEDCSLPLARCAALAKQTGTRPTVDKHTISRFGPTEWQLHNESLSNDAKEAVRNAKNIMFNTKMINDQVYSPVDTNQAENNMHIRNRARIVYLWKLELEKHNSEVTDELGKFHDLIQQFMRCNQTVNIIVNINRDMQKVRNLRLPPDLVHDAVTDELIKEQTLCAQVINLNKRYIDELKKQTKELKDAKQRLEHDWSDKKSAYDVDTVCLSTNNSSDTLQWKPGCARLSDGQSTVANHEYFTKESIIFIRAALARSRILRECIKDTIKKSAKDLREQANNVEAALMSKITEISQACRKLELSLDRCLKSLNDTEVIFGKITGAVRKLDAPMKCAQTRLDIRSGRDNVENCRDAPQFGLINEIKTISESVSALLSQTKGAEEAIEALSKSRQNIEREIAVKQKTLWVDNERCRFLRSCFPSDQALYGYK